MELLLIGYVVIINIITFAAYGIDKSRAKKHVYRIPERTLIGMAAAGGSVGALLGMGHFRHKTRHLKFTAGVPLILGVQVVLIVMVLVRL
ncbi:MAG TPA: DUF1294 domain-containing protein [Candidatus Pelethocola excrementipullorum]|nr:DUF1294 domain-containing protein [Candidatus Pelethocola excrementipullorum]